MPATSARTFRIAVTLLLLNTTPCLARWPVEYPLYQLGDVDNDGSIQIDDAIAILRALYQGAELPCEKAANFDRFPSDPLLTVSDALALIGYLFGGDPELFLMAGICHGSSPDDGLTCERPPAHCGRSAIIYLSDMLHVSARGEPIAKAKRELIRRVNELAPDQEFALVIYGDTVIHYPEGPEPARASEETVEEAIAWLNVLQTDSERRCGASAFRKALEFAGSARSERIEIGALIGGCLDCDGDSDNDLDETRSIVDETRRLTAGTGVRLHLWPIGDPDCQAVLEALGRS